MPLVSYLIGKNTFSPSLEHPPNRRNYVNLFLNDGTSEKKSGPFWDQSFMNMLTTKIVKKSWRVKQNEKNWKSGQTCRNHLCILSQTILYSNDFLFNQMLAGNICENRKRILQTRNTPTNRLMLQTSETWVPRCPTWKMIKLRSQTREK